MKLKTKKPNKPEPINIYFNDYIIEDEDPNKIFTIVIESLPDLKYWSYQSLKRFYTQMLTLLRNYCLEKREQKKGGYRAKLTRFANGIPNKLRYISEDREELLMQIYEVVMRDSGCGLMRRN